MYSKILVPLDGSRLAEGVLPYARAFAEALKIPVELFQVVEPEPIATFSDPEHGRYVDAVQAGLKGSALDYLEAVAASFFDSLAVDCSVEIGRPAEAIVHKGAAQGRTLVAMATHGRSGLRRWLLGSVAEKVLRASSNHLLLIRPSGDIQVSGVARLDKAIVALDGSPLAENAIPPVALLAKKMDMEIQLLQVYALPRTSYVADEYLADMEQMRQTFRAQASDYLEARAYQLQAEGLGRVASLALEGDAAEVIINIARRTANNLVVMCTHGRSGIGRWVLGSVTEKVVRHSGDPVLVIRAGVLDSARRRDYIEL